MTPWAVPVVVGWLAGWLVIGRALFVWQVRSLAALSRKERYDPFVPVVVGFFWPLATAVVVVALPFVGAGWLISRPVRPRRWRPFGRV